jgi:oligopeptide/dipeptide ABC transporter ATP-binding protein
MSGTEESMAEHLVEVEDLTVRVTGRDGPPILDAVSFTVEPGKMTALVGESGAGKSMTTKAVLGVLDDRLFKVSGRILIAGQDVGAMRASARRRYTSSVTSLVFQNPTKALNPTMRIGPQIAEALRFSAVGQHLSAGQAHDRAVELMKQVGIAAPQERYHAYPHEMSGGMKQRAVIAIALSMNPRVLFCDEPTSSLDVTTQALIMDLLDELRERLGIGILFITHDLVLAASRADDVLVLHSGRVVENMPVRDIFETAAMPYTRDLIGRVPGAGERPQAPPAPLPLEVGAGPAACRYVGQCAFQREICVERVPPLARIGPAHLVRCWFPVGHEPLDQSAEPDPQAVGAATPQKGA